VDGSNAPVMALTVIPMFGRRAAAQDAELQAERRP
jgi:hypothetical protein